jgi:endonuclease I
LLSILESPEFIRGEYVKGSNPITYRGNGKIFKASSRVAVPDVSILGDIARIAFYMRDTYGVAYSKRQSEVFNEWHKQDAVSDEEILLNQRIKKTQGIGNPYALRN